MKTRVILALTLWTSITAASAMASPERITIKKSQERSKERAAASQIRNIDVRDIEDPVARKAIKEILNYLNLNAKN